MLTNEQMFAPDTIPLHLFINLFNRTDLLCLQTSFFYRRYSQGMIVGISHPFIPHTLGYDIQGHVKVHYDNGCKSPWRSTEQIPNANWH